jgi:hypothetical protein
LKPTKPAARTALCASVAKAAKDITITSGTLFASHKLPLRGYLAVIAVFCNKVKGKSALALSPTWTLLQVRIRPPAQAARSDG